MNWFSRRRSKTGKDLDTSHLDDLIDAANADPTRRAQFHKEFLESEVLVPSCQGPGETPGLARLDLVIVTASGREAVVVFSSLDRLQAARPKLQTIDKVGLLRLQGRKVMELVNSIAPDTGVLLNPETSVTVWFPPATVRAMAEGRPPDPGRFVEIAAGEEAYLGQPAKYPSRLVEALVGLFQRLGVVEQGYLAQVYVPSDKSPPHVVIGIKLVPNSPMEFKTLVPEMGQLASGVLGQGEVVDFMEIGDDRISKYMSGEAKPF